MKAIVYKKYGSPDVLKLKEVDKPTPKDNEVLVNVKAASVNSWDLDLLTGRPYLYRLMSGIFKPSKKIIGCDISGVIESVGNKVDRLKIGDEVFGDISESGWGGFAEYVCVKENFLAVKSPKMTFEEAASTPHCALLAIQGLNKYGSVQQGQNILINGSGGGVGTFAIQLAKLHGAEVTCIDKAEKLDLLRSLGADHVVDYLSEDFAQTDRRYDLILDPMAHRSLRDYLSVMSPKGKYVMIGGKVKRIFQLAIRKKRILKTTDKQVGLLLYKPNTKDLNTLTELYEAGKLVPIIDKSYPLNEITDAFQCLIDGRSKGKLVITM